MPRIRNGLNNYGITIPYSTGMPTVACRAWYASRTTSRLRITMKWSDDKRYNLGKVEYRKFFTKV